VIELHEVEPVNVHVVQYLNRLSDYLFTLCRIMASELNAPEAPWKPRM
jgi:cob(I)alamin adenosyltransferase